MTDTIVVDEASRIERAAMSLVLVSGRQAHDLELLDEWRRLLAVKEETVEARGRLYITKGGIGVGNDEQALVWQKANNRIYKIKDELFGTFLA